MNAAKIDRSDRLKRVVRLLADGRWHSRLEIIRRAQVCAVSSIAAEIRANRRRVDCERRGNVWRYRMVRP